MRRMTMILLASLVALGGLGCAHKPKTANVDVIFVKYDTNRDGIITKDEFVQHWTDKQRADTAWKKLDPNGTGSLSRTQANDVPFDVWSELESQNEP